MEGTNFSLEKKILTGLEKSPGEGLTFYGTLTEAIDAGADTDHVRDELETLQEAGEALEIIEFSSGVGLGYSVTVTAYKLPVYTAYYIDTDDNGTHLLALGRGYSDQDALAVIHALFDDWFEEALNPDTDEETDAEWFLDAEDSGGSTCLETNDPLVLWIVAGMPPLPTNEDGERYAFESAEEWETYLEENMPED